MRKPYVSPSKTAHHFDKNPVSSNCVNLIEVATELYHVNLVVYVTFSGDGVLTQLEIWCAGFLLESL